MIPRKFWVYDDDLDMYDSYAELEPACDRAQEVASAREVPIAVMLTVPGPQEFPELRAVAVFDSSGRKVWETDVYDSELAIPF